MHDGCIHVKSGQPCAPLTGRGHVDTAWWLLCPRGIQIHMYEFIHFLKIYFDVLCVRCAYSLLLLVIGTKQWTPCSRFSSAAAAVAAGAISQRRRQRNAPTPGSRPAPSRSSRTSARRANFRCRAPRAICATTSRPTRLPMTTVPRVKHA